MKRELTHGGLVLGIDPGLAATGFGAVRYDRRDITVVHAATITTKPDRQYSKAQEAQDAHVRAMQVCEYAAKLVETLRPQLVVIEAFTDQGRVRNTFAKRWATALVAGALGMTMEMLQAQLVWQPAGIVAGPHAKLRGYVDLWAQGRSILPGDQLLHGKGAVEHARDAAAHAVWQAMLLQAELRRGL